MPKRHNGNPMFAHYFRPLAFHHESVVAVLLWTLFACTCCRGQSARVHDELAKLCDPPEEVLRAQPFALGNWAGSFVKETETLRLLGRMGRTDVSSTEIADDFEKTAKTYGVDSCPLVAHLRSR